MIFCVIAILMLGSAVVYGFGRMVEMTPPMVNMMSR
jgi:hypothetical protein